MTTRHNPRYLAICAIFRDEARYLEEWLHFHLAVGVEHFFLYDNHSSDGPETVLAPFVDAGLVTHISWPIPFHERAQSRAYADCLERTRGLNRWVAFIDIDEFLFSPTAMPLPAVLHRFEPFPGVVAHWQVYGSNGHEEMTDEPVIERFTRRAPTGWVRNRKVKSIVDPARAVRPICPHHFSYRDGELAVDETGRRIDFRRKSRYAKSIKRLYGCLGSFGPLFPIDPYKGADVGRPGVMVALLRVNHYPVKSREEFLFKARFKKERRRYDDVDYFAYHDRNEIDDPILVGYFERLQALNLDDDMTPGLTRPTHSRKPLLAGAAS